MPSLIPRLSDRAKWQRGRAKRSGEQEPGDKARTCPDCAHAHFTSLWNSYNVHVHCLPAKLLLMLICLHVHENESYLTYQSLCKCACYCMCCLVLIQCLSGLALRYSACWCYWFLLESSTRSYSHVHLGCREATSWERNRWSSQFQPEYIQQVWTYHIWRTKNCFWSCEQASRCPRTGNWKSKCSHHNNTVII